MGGTVLWITGLPGSGKSSIADAFKEGHPDFYLLRMDELRKVVTPQPSYSEQERDLVYRSLVYLAKTLSDLGHSIIIDATGNRLIWREVARSLIRGYVEVYLKCSQAVCRTREEKRADSRGAPRAIYEKGGKGWPVPGVNVPYEEAVAPEIVIDSETTSIDEASAIIKEYLASRNRL